MNTIFIKLFFSEVSIYIFLHMVSFALFEIKNKNNFTGGLFTILFTLFSIIYSNIIFWIN